MSLLRYVLLSLGLITIGVFPGSVFASCAPGTEWEGNYTIICGELPSPMIRDQVEEITECIRSYDQPWPRGKTWFRIMANGQRHLELERMFACNWQELADEYYDKMADYYEQVPPRNGNDSGSEDGAGSPGGSGAPVYVYLPRPGFTFPGYGRTIICTYTDGVGNPDNHWSCPATDPRHDDEIGDN